jgi:hypothetical protein
VNVKMESIYELAFPHINFSLSGDTFVKCPFKHTLQDGQKYYDETPSLSVNVEKGIHHCFGCGAKGNELQFLADYMGITLDTAVELYEILKNANETIEDWKRAEKTLELNPQYNELLETRLKFSPQVIKQLHIGVEGPGRGVAFPVFLFDKLVDVITYNPGKVPKYMKRSTSKNGFIMPYDEWRHSVKSTTICAGQKDLAIALTHGINAITITGGEGNLPRFFYREFEDRVVQIIYDNDDAGRNGAIAVAVALKPYAQSIKIIDLSPICVEKGEDLWDFFVKYGKTKDDLVTLISKTKEFSEEDYQIEKEKLYPTISLTAAMHPNYHNKIVRSNVQVVAVDEEKFLMPTSATATKIGFPEEGTPAANKLKLHEKRYWNYKIEQAKDLFYLIDGNISEHNISKNLKEMMHLAYESYIAITINTQEPVYKCTVTDHMEAFSLEDTITEFAAYSVKHKLESGKKYKVTYKLVPHPISGSVLTMVIFGVEESQDSVSAFKITDENKRLLDIFKVKNNSLQNTVEQHVERVKGIVNADYENTLIKIIDLFYHTPLQFKAGNATLRAYLDTLIVAESRVGKTTTVQALQKVYGLGIRVPLNGHNASIAGIIGGSHKTTKGYQIRAGVVPRSHKGAVIFEELAKAKNDLLRELTEIRSSSMVAISRVSGTFHMPAFVRMLSLTNAKTNGAVPKPIASYPNGIEILIDLVGTAEDIARYDVIGILPGRQNYVIDPFFTPQEPYPKDAYQARIRWAWSRTAEQVTIEKEVFQYAIQKANIVNKDFESYIKIFGPETYLKLIRIGIAVACYTVSTDNTYERVVVNKEHIDYAANFLLELYDNDTFRLRQFVHAERQFREVTDENVKTLEKLWMENQTILLHLENYSRTAQKNLQTLSGMDQSEFSNFMSRLVKDMFIQFDGYDIIPTERFRKCMQTIDRTLKNRYLRL